MTPSRSSKRGLTLLITGLMGLAGLWWWSRLTPTQGLDLPLRFLDPSPRPQPRTRSRTLVVFLTSDSGWLGLNTTMPKALAAAGYPTVSWNSFRYYLRERTPDEAARDLARVLDAAAERWDYETWTVVGYSFGAGVLPFLVNRLPHAQRESLGAFAFLAYPGVASFRFRPSGWLLRLHDSDRSATDEVRRMPKVPSVCIAGEDDPIRDCRSVEDFGIERRLLPLGHGLQPAFDEILPMVLATLSRARVQHDSIQRDPPADRATSSAPR